jgi:histidinol phosphatase-like enzyme (inositol monophosphatase family)
MQTYIEKILEITEEAAKIPREYFRGKLDIENKGDASPVTIADKKTEDYIRTELHRHFPDHSILGEEFGQTTRDSDYHWIIDPIDGTRSFISGLPLYGMLVALLHHDKPVFGMIRMPEQDEVYTGSADGAFLNGNRRVHVSDTTALDQAILYINEGDKLVTAEPEIFRTLCASGAERRLGYDCYPHALVASGHVDACVDYDLKPYDFLALTGVIEPAGGIITDWDGNPLTLHSDGRIVSAATPELHAEILNILRS